ncbi:putative integral membrane protein [Erysiphe neolycopersici]|uniref:Putative integral membrane protein n=1 Tax=Erysiphe neolycopersici TaxID=212602 RepID=A0A420I8M0_9PEZI|nr:putative integral membrane protein [Erysiphe neolycopersici]
MPNDNVNLTTQYEELHWNSSPAWRLPSWAEPLMVVAILMISMFATRRKNYRILYTSNHLSGLLDKNVYEDEEEESISDYILLNDHAENWSIDSLNLEKQQNSYLCWNVDRFRNKTGRFSRNLQSRIMQKFPFLIEMFYWVITYGFYRCTAILSQAIFSKTGIWNVAQNHGLSILQIEHTSLLSFLWPVSENEVQQWFMQNHQYFLTVLNRSYALIHIPGTVGFIGWYYYAAASHDTFATVRRTMTLTNLLAFTIFVMYPCMPPRLLPREYGFLDSVGRNNSESIWMSGKYVNSLAAMPSMHFGYAFCIGCTMIYHSGILHRILRSGEAQNSKIWTLLYTIFGIWYPTWILITIVATANHYYLDACVAFIVVIIAFLCNRVLTILLPLEHFLLWVLRMEKPRPTTGSRY